MGTLDVLTMLGLPDALVESCREILEEHAATIHSASPPTVGSVFGGSGHGATLEHHTSIAHQHVADALNQMVAGLQGYATNLHEFSRDLQERDLQAAADLTPSRKAELADIASNLDSTNFHNSGGGEG
ncbi:hypothetical protein [Nocardioides sp. URHA0020]|uniref:hypothetical protein n=1 Tax=Nocardioides sp. URHA0020 TaxID=1380392 RepID=UPI00048A5ED9|nr:hypothetical protein [Nocardioides sp. URHA0020]